jgi:hypothetical protein
LARVSMLRRIPSDLQGPPPVATPRWQADLVVIVIGCALYMAFLLWLHSLLMGVPLIAI